jgi:hypothetical protein
MLKKDLDQRIALNQICQKRMFQMLKKNFHPMGYMKLVNSIVLGKSIKRFIRNNVPLVIRDQSKTFRSNF